VDTGERTVQCRIKGKVLKTEQKRYNPIAVGDIVDFQPDPHSENLGYILGHQQRDTVFVRWNKKRNAAQVIAANADLLLCVSSAQSPPFRPRFVDRLLVSGEHGDLRPVILLNKTDLGVDRQTAERLRRYRRMGYTVIRCSALNDLGIKRVKRLLRGKTTVVVGQSGVGKSTLLNVLDPGLNLKVGEISAKYDRGAHTTNYAVMVSIRGLESTLIIDTPGIREFEVAEVQPEELYHYFRDFLPFARNCSYYACTHIDEPQCAVLAAVGRGKIHSDRYESYVRIFNDLKAFQKVNHGRSFN
jgi:ribosome biogenesis GTPase